MRKNLPVTDHEKTFAPDQKLISSTDLKGRIRHCNDAFVEVSGFTRDELIGQPHNIIRHPDMPPQAYKNLWSQLKAGRPWMGLVKNRCKNGDYYWVSAYVTPVTENGKIVGYESVRSGPSREEVQRAEHLYARINAGKKSRRIPNRILGVLGLALVSLLTAIALHRFGYTGYSAAVTSVALVLCMLYVLVTEQQTLRRIKTSLGNSFLDELSAHSYFGDASDIGQIMVGIMSQRAHLDAVLTRLGSAADDVAASTRRGRGVSEDSQELLQQQQDETQQVAAAVHQMAMTNADVSDNVQATSDRAFESSRFVKEGREVVIETRGAIEQLKNTVEGVSASVLDLAGQTQSISKAAGVIAQIAEQTNLLALNAAIEAARAGEHGRGFAVVAEEVRRLVSLTAESTTEINAILARLTEQSDQSVEKARAGADAAEAGHQMMLKAEAMLTEIADAVANISDRAIQMAAAVEQQSQVSDQVSGQVERISSLAQQNFSKGTSVGDSFLSTLSIAEELRELVVRFQH